MTDRQRLVLLATTMATVPFVILFEGASVFGVLAVGLGINLLVLGAPRPDPAQSSATVRLVALRPRAVLALAGALVAIGVTILVAR